MFYLLCLIHWHIISSTRAALAFSRIIFPRNCSIITFSLRMTSWTDGRCLTVVSWPSIATPSSNASNWISNVHFYCTEKRQFPCNFHNFPLPMQFAGISHYFSLFLFFGIMHENIISFIALYCLQHFFSTLSSHCIIVQFPQYIIRTNICLSRGESMWDLCVIEIENTIHHPKWKIHIRFLPWFFFKSTLVLPVTCHRRDNRKH